MSSEYTPTTEQVSSTYAAYQSSDLGGLLPAPTAEEAEAAFDRWLSTEIRNAKVEALRNAAMYLDESTQADVNNYIGRPQPTFSHTERYADVQWLRQRAVDIQMGRINE